MDYYDAGLNSDLAKAMGRPPDAWTPSSDSPGVLVPTWYPGGKMADDDLSSLLQQLDNSAGGQGSYAPGNANGLQLPDSSTGMQLYSAQAGSYTTDSLALVPAAAARLAVKGAKMLAQVVRLGIAADASGLMQAAQMIANFIGAPNPNSIVAKFLKRRSRGSGRRRGITFRQLANAKRVNHTISKMYHQLHHGGGGYRAQPVPFRRRRSSRRRSR